MILRRYALVTAAVITAVLVSGAASSAASERRHIPLGTAEIGALARTAAVGSSFTPLTPVRVLDTRNGPAPVGQRGTITVSLSAHVPESASAVVLNVTGTAPTTSTFVTVYPTGAERPTVSNLNLGAGQTRPNAVTVALGLNRSVNLFNFNGSVHLIADLAGYYSADTGSLFTTQAPVRVLDTRSGGPVGPGGTITLDLSGRVPATATAVTFNLTGIAGSASTFVTAWPTGAPRPTVSNLNLAPGQIAPNLVTVALSADRRVNLFNFNGSTHLVADLAGFYATDQGASFNPVVPVRVIDTRPDNGLTPDIIGVVSFDGDLPVNTTAIVANLTGTNATASMFVTAWSADQVQPNASNLNLLPGQTIPNLITTGLGTDPDLGTPLSLNLANNSGYVDILLDVAGFFTVP